MPQLFAIGNPSFESSPVVWTIYNSKADQFSSDLASEEWSYDGSKSLKLFTDAITHFVEDNYVEAYQDINVNLGGGYYHNHEEFTFRWKADLGDYCEFRILFRNTPTSAWQTLLTLPTNTQGEGFAVVRIPTGYTGILAQDSRLKLQLYSSGGTTGGYPGGHYIYIDNIIERGSTESGNVKLTAASPDKNAGQIYGFGGENPWMSLWRLNMLNYASDSWCQIDIWAPWDSGGIEETYPPPPTLANQTFHLNDEVILTTPTYPNERFAIKLYSISGSSFAFKLRHWNKYDNTFFVDTVNGDDTDTGNCWTNAFQTFAKGYDSITSGGELFVVNGNYSGETVTYNKSATIRPAQRYAGKVININDLVTGTLIMPTS